jgi:phosphoserine phosphatase
VTTLLVVFDVDSTLIQEEVIELLAANAGSLAEVAEVTERAMRGELDFEQSLRARVKTLAGLDADVLLEAYDQINLTPGALELIQYVHKLGGKVAAVSGGFNQLLEPLAQRLGLDYRLANQLEIIDGKLTGEVIGDIIDKPAKATALRAWANELGLELSQTIAVGDGANDLDMLGAAGLGIGFCGKPRVRAAADILVNLNDLSQVIGLIGQRA